MIISKYRTELTKQHQRGIKDPQRAEPPINLIQSEQYLRRDRWLKNKAREK